MKTLNISVLLFLFASFAAVAADTAPMTSAPPSVPVSTPATSPDSTSATKPPADAAKATIAKPVPDAKTGDKTQDGDFKPSEEISEDMAVAYPVDI